MHPVKLYVYDLSNGMARQLSRQLTGKQIDGIWHTSIVVFDREVFYGQGINTTAPGQSHHGSPLHIIDLGETDIDEDTFGEYIKDLRDHYTADKYHLLDFNCNSFTNDVAGFLTGSSIPDWIKDLPTDFLSTPFGQALRPTIDSMYHRPTPSATPAPTPLTSGQAPDPALAASILQSVAEQAQRNVGSSTTRAPMSLPATESLAAPLHQCTNSASFHNLLRTHRAVVANFSNVATCMPCRMIAPIYEDLARNKGVSVGNHGVGAAFIKIDMSTPMGNQLASEWSVRVMPTFMFFLNSKKIHEMRGADEKELRAQIDLLIFQAYPPHPHTSLSLPSFQALSLNPILFTQAPSLDTVSNKFASFIDAAPWPSDSPQSQAQVKASITGTIVPYLKSRFASKATTAGKSPLPSATPVLISMWATITAALATILAPESLFPLADMWRLGFLDPAVGTWCATNPLDPITILLSKVTNSSPRNYTLTVIRMLSNAFSTPLLAQRLLIGASKASLTAFLIPSLLHEDATVRTSAASLAFNASAFVQKGRVDKVRNGGRTSAEDEDEDWEVEMVSAIIEAVGREKENEDVVHRLTASLACLLRVSPFYENQLVPLLEVLQARDVLKSKLEKAGCGPDGVKKPEVRKLVEEVAMKLCP
ncbi:PPPDE putative peptidase domain-containing protein [Desarmillaria tabescens]|uniref:PPPDE putative peptidase domain-containing protein n=1 Tax=Armillaria tabescens TaxID=1929756 RepID=A0AA39NEZ6_ARMTA|nr:PPPDE putative peptidase domain-containing protein [Desarmillaria tabescens]KAK0464417.1 PPPDE putative peptidase domain-containing protein [Desarmillaria tabescens]